MNFRSVLVVSSILYCTLGWSSIASADFIYFNQIPDLSSTTSGIISRYDTVTGQLSQPLITGLDYPRDLALDLVNGKIYWVNGASTLATADQIQRSNLDGSGEETLFTVQSDSLRGIALDAQNGKLYYGNRFTGTIYSYDVTTKTTQSVVTGAGNIAGISLDTTAGNLYWFDGTANAVKQASVNGTPTQVVIPYPADPVALDLVNGKLYAAAILPGQGAAVTISNLDGSSLHTILPGVNSNALAVVPSENILYGQAGGAIWSSTLDGGNYNEFLSGLQNVQALDVDSIPLNDPRPSLQTLANLSADVYNSVATGSPGYSQTDTNTGLIPSQASHKGFRAVAYATSDQSQVVIAFRGSDLSDGTLTAIKNLGVTALPLRGQGEEGLASDQVSVWI